ncbi:MAG: hypothetical protein AB7N71_07010 [Phycisphaerae bacterium]
MNEAIQYTHLVSTLLLVGLIWVIQLVHYPLFARVGTDSFPAYEREHQLRITLIIGPLMPLETAAALGMLFVADAGTPRVLAIVGFALVAANWLSTWLLQVPCHKKLSKGFDAAAHRRLVNTNWLRTMAWTLRGGIAVILFSA